MTVTILLVEDEPTLRTGTEQFLRQRGFTVLTAASGEEALEKFTGADVIILDIMLPGMRCCTKFAKRATCRC